MTDKETHQEKVLLLRHGDRYGHLVAVNSRDLKSLLEALMSREARMFVSEGTRNAATQMFADTQHGDIRPLGTVPASGKPFAGGYIREGVVDQTYGVCATRAKVPEPASGSFTPPPRPGITIKAPDGSVCARIDTFTETGGPVRPGFTAWRYSTAPEDIAWAEAGEYALRVLGTDGETYLLEPKCPITEFDTKQESFLIRGVAFDEAAHDRFLTFVANKAKSKPVHFAIGGYTTACGETFTNSRKAELTTEPHRVTCKACLDARVDLTTFPAGPLSEPSEIVHDAPYAPEPIKPGDGIEAEPVEGDTDPWTDWIEHTGNICPIPWATPGQFDVIVQIGKATTANYGPDKITSPARDAFTWTQSHAHPVTHFRYLKSAHPSVTGSVLIIWRGKVVWDIDTVEMDPDDKQFNDIAAKKMREAALDLRHGIRAGKITIKMKTPEELDRELSSGYRYKTTQDARPRPSHYTSPAARNVSQGYGRLDNPKPGPGRPKITDLVRPFPDAVRVDPIELTEILCFVLSHPEGSDHCPAHVIHLARKLYNATSY